MNTKTVLLDTAETLACRRGFDGFSYSDLADCVGIRKASVHYHYPTKADLSAALISRYRAMLLNRLASISENELRASGRLLAFLDLYRAASQGGRSLCLCIAFSVTQNALPDRTRREVERLHKDVVQWLQAVFRLALADGTIRAVADPGAEARGALALVEGAHIMARAATDMARFEAAIDILRARAL